MRFKLLPLFIFLVLPLFAQTAEDAKAMRSKPRVLSTGPGAQKNKAEMAAESGDKTATENKVDISQLPVIAEIELGLLKDAATQKEDKKEISFERLSLSDKLAQTIFVSADIDRAQRLKDPIEKGLIGGVLIQWGDYSLDQTRELISKLQSWAANSKNKIPLLISIDYEGGTVYTPVTLGFQYLPTNMMLAAADNPEDTTALFYIVAKELRSVGVHINFAPVIDVNINPSNPIIGVRSFGSDTELVGDMGVALITGLQKGGVMAVAKHFPGHGETTIDSHLDLPHLIMPEEQFRTVHLAPFYKAMDAGVKGVMTAHIVYDFIDQKDPATFSHKILNDLLKKEMNFNGLVITDSLDMAGATKDGSITTAAEKALAAGTDILLTAQAPAVKTHKDLLSKINKTIPEQRVEEAAKKIFELKKELGLFEESSETTIPITEYTEAFDYFADKITKQAVTVVKAQEGIIPFKYEGDGVKKPKLCSVFFSPARFANQLPAFNTPFLNKGWEVMHYNAQMTPQAKDIRRAKKCMENADLVVLGSMQWADKPNKAQKRIIDGLLKEDKKIILLSLMSPYDIKFYPQAPNIVALYGINKLSAIAAADIILGNIEAEGSLPISLKELEK